MKKIPFQNAKIQMRYVFLALIVLALGFYIAQAMKTEVKTPYYDEQLRASCRMAEALLVLRAEVDKRGIAIEADDLNKTGLIGPEFTELTSTPGTLEAKRSVLNPNFAALIVKYFHEAGLKPGDHLAVGTSGSFPGLALAVFSAATEMGLETDVIASYGSSMYGGTRPEFPLPVMLGVLRAAGVIDYTMLAVSPGGLDDYGETVLFANSREVIMKLAEAEGVEFIDYNDIEKSIARRLALFGEDVDLFVNIGGASPNSGTSPFTLDFPNGLVMEPPVIPTTANRGLMYEYAARGVPVVNMLNVRKLADDNFLPYDPVPLPKPGEGGVYYERQQNLLAVWVGMFLGLAILGVGIRSRRKG